MLHDQIIIARNINYCT